MCSACLHTHTPCFPILFVPFEPIDVNNLLSLSVSVFTLLCAVMNGALGVMDGLISSEGPSLDSE